jgi:cytochrome P450
VEVLTYNPFLPEVREDPYPTYHALREADPVHRSPLMDTWILTRYEDVALVLRDGRFLADRRNWAGYQELPGADNTRRCWPWIRRITRACADWSARRSRRGWSSA